MDDLPPAAPALRDLIRCDIVIIGAGIAGLTTAYYLTREGKDVLVIDSGPPGGGMTCRTTAHLSNALDDRWQNLISRMGSKKATLAADAHSAAIDEIERLQAEIGVDCDFARVPGYLVLGPEHDKSFLEDELKAAHGVGLIEVTLEGSAPIAGTKDNVALRFPNQARFHPLKYIRGLVAAIERQGGRIATAHVTAVKDGTPATIETREGASVAANYVVVATNAPINDRLVIHTKQAPYRSYVVAGLVPRGSVPDALIWDTRDPYHYVRLQPRDDRHDVLIVGGEDHKSGQEFDMDKRLAALEHWAGQHFQAFATKWRWSGQVMETVDYLGYLGRNPGTAKNVYVITGDSGMGMTHGTIGAMIISNDICGRPSQWADAFDPGRVTLKAAGTYAEENLNVAAQMVDHVTAGDVKDSDHIRAGEGAILRRGAHKIAAYRTPEGELIERSAVCPHVGCVVAWNAFEKCWDCPCHGSQFGPDGKVMNGPATSDLAAVNGD
jgi:glycine/D-amino acid oxidase-like deaminating enzyme/nitrite reductase/ring-hydroxylating ferredoxin subunit